MNNTKLFVILGNQLFNPIYIDRIKEFDFYMSEDFGLCSYVKHHKFKILQTLSAMLIKICH
jgi:deoxyribodipyrimidine photolyase-related protein